jgi:hypothetical protein
VLQRFILHWAATHDFFFFFFETHHDQTKRGHRGKENKRAVVMRSDKEFCSITSWLHRHRAKQ